MEDNAKTIDKTIGDLTVKDVIVIGAALYTMKVCGRVLLMSVTPAMVKATEKLKSKTEAMKAEQNNRK